MGYDIGKYECRVNGKMHIQLSEGVLDFRATSKIKPVMQLSKEDAVKLYKALEWSLPYYYGVEF